tara:strand:- start:628 stop:828 length:201 start_codon:yes stop_codon:yes gene_type:complete
MTIEELIVELQHSIDNLGFKKNALVVFDVQDSEGVIDQTDSIDIDDSSCKEILPINIRLNEEIKDE